MTGSCRQTPFLLLKNPWLSRMVLSFVSSIGTGGDSSRITVPASGCSSRPPGRAMTSPLGPTRRSTPSMYIFPSSVINSLSAIARILPPSGSHPLLLCQDLPHRFDEVNCCDRVVHVGSDVVHKFWRPITV